MRGEIYEAASIPLYIMLTDHPTSEDFEAFFRYGHGPDAYARNARVLRHLLAECSSCRRLLHAIGWGEHRLERLLSYPFDREEDGRATLVLHYDYSRAFAAAEQALDAFFAEGIMRESSLDDLLAELAPLSQEEQERRVKSYSRFADTRLVQRLIEMSKAVRYENAARMLHLAKLAVWAAEACTI